MLMGGWSNTISMIASWCSTRSRSSATGPFPLQEVAHGTLEGDAGTRARVTRRDERDRGEGAEQPGDRVGHRGTTEPGRVVAGTPAAPRLGCRSVARAVVVDERGDAQAREL